MRGRLGALLTAAVVGSALVASCSTGGDGVTAGGASSAPSAASGDGDSRGPWPAAARAVFGRDVGARSAGSFGADRVEVVHPAELDGAAALKVTYPEGSASEASRRADGTPAGGAQIYLPLRSGSRASLWLHYRVRFQGGFRFVKGGKLPGLYGGSRTSGGRIPDGDDGLSTRLMWRTGGAGEVYAYLPTSKVHGTSIGRGDFHFPTGTWVSITQHVQLNHLGRRDGSVELWVDGHRVISADHLVFRDTKELKIDGIFFSTFFGGNDRSWASPRDQWAEFTGFAVSSDRPDHV